jgi:sulfate permease, SulP family
VSESTRGGLGADVIAGLSVALVLVPQALAYAELAGMPAWHGLYAAATAPILAAPFVSSRYLQTGPVALTALLTFGALGGLAATGSAEYVGLAAVLALVVGLTRLTIGALRLGAVAWLMSKPVLQGFTLGAAILISGSQLAAAVGASPPPGRVLERAGWTVMNPGEWTLGAVVLTVVTITLMFQGKRLHALFPGVLVAAAIGLAAGALGQPVGPLLGEVPTGLPPLTLDLPWASLSTLLVPGMVIALVGFAEPAAIARTFAALDRERWDPNREFISQGVANVVSGVFSGFPVGGSFSRSGLARLAGARSRWAGAIGGLAVLGFLPFANLLAPLPRAILGATVLGAVLKLLDPRPLIAHWKQSRPQALTAWGTLFATLAAAPHVEYGVLAGIGLSAVLHIWREMKVELETRFEGNTLTLKPIGVLWFGSAPSLEDALVDALAGHEEVHRILIDLSGAGRLDLNGADALATLIEDARNADIDVRLLAVPRHAERILRKRLPDVPWIEGEVRAKD